MSLSPLLLRWQSTRLTKWIPWLLFIASFGVFAFTAAPSIGSRDAAEFALAVPSLGIPHPPGYPLYVLVAKAFTALTPFGTPAYQVNLASGFFASLAGVLLYHIFRKLSVRPMLAVLATFTFTFSRLFWFYAVIADVFTLHLLLIALISWLLLSWHVDRSTPRTKNWKLVAAAVVFGLGLGNHHTIVFLLPAIGWLAWQTDRSVFRPKHLLRLAALALLPVVVLYTFVLLRSRANPFLDWGDPETLPNVLAVFLRREFGTVFLSKNFVTGWNLPTFWPHLQAFVISLLRQFHYWGLALAGYGFFRLWQTRRAFAQYSGLAYLGLGPLVLLLTSNIPFDANIDFVTEKLYLASYLCVALWLGYGMQRLLTDLSRLPRQWQRLGYVPTAVAVLIVIIVLLPIYNLTANWRLSGHRGYWHAHQYVANILASLEPNAVLITPNDTIVFGTWYFQEVLNERKDVTVVLTSDNPIALAQFRERNTALFDSPTSTNSNLNRIFGAEAGQIPPLAELLRETILRSVDTRPVYFSAGDAALTRGLTDYLLPTGLVFKLLSEPNAVTSDQLLASDKIIRENYNAFPFPRLTAPNYPEREIALRYLIAYNDLGFYFLSQANYASATDYFFKAKSISNDPIVANNLTLLQLAQLADQREVDDLTAEELANVSTLYYQTRQFAKAIERSAELVRREPENIDYRVLYAASLLANNQLAAAERQFNLVLEQTPEHPGAKQGVETVRTLLED